MTVAQTAFLFLAISSLSAHACNEGASRNLANKELPEKANAAFDVAEQQSAEGGEWTVYNGPSGKPQHIVRTDYGEMGRVQLLLAIFNDTDYMIKKTYTMYAAPLYIGAGTIREEIDFIEFCDAKLDMPGEGEWASNETYEKLARESADAFFKAPEIASTIKAAGLTPPLWK